MKKSLLLLLLIGSIQLISCGDDDKKDTPAEVPSAYTSLPGTLIVEDETWSGTKTLTGAYYILPGVTLTIEPGTVIKFTYHNNNPDSVGAIFALKADPTNFSTPRASARLEAEGTAANPIIFTSAKTTKAAGDWGGIVLIGEAPNNIPGGIGDVEGVSSEIQYGGSNTADNSGTLKYVRIEYCGFGLITDSELNGLSLYSCGSGTTLDHVQVYKCTDDGFEFFGGSVNAKYLVSAYNDDDSFDHDQGWNGKGQFWLGVQTTGADNGFESDGRHTLGSGNPTKPTIYNVTLYGLGTGKDAADGNRGMRLREDFEGTLKNFLVTNFAGVAWRLESASGDSTSRNYDKGLLTITNAVVYNNDRDVTVAGNYGGFNSLNDSTRFFSAANVTEANPNFTNVGSKDFSVQAGSPCLSNAATPPSDGFFDVSATYRGAMGSANWATGSWVRWSD